MAPLSFRELVRRVREVAFESLCVPGSPFENARGAGIQHDPAVFTADPGWLCRA